MIIDGHVYCLPERLRNPRVKLPASEEVIANAIYRHAESERALALSAPAAILKSMAVAKIDRSVLVAFPWRSAKLCSETNEYLITLAKSDPHFLCIAAVQPLQRGWQKLARACLDNHAIGLKVNPAWQGYGLDSAAMDALCRFAAEHNTFVMMHVDAAYKKSPASPAALFELIKRHPRTRIWASHLGGLLGLYHVHAPVKKLFKNLWFDTAVSATLQFVDFYVQAGLQHKIIFGSDFPFNHSHSQMQVLRGLQDLRLDLRVNQGILSQNFLRMIA